MASDYEFSIIIWFCMLCYLFKQHQALHFGSFVVCYICFRTIFSSSLVHQKNISLMVLEEMLGKVLLLNCIFGIVWAERTLFKHSCKRVLFEKKNRSKCVATIVGNFATFFQLFIETFLSPNVFLGLAAN